MVGKIMSYKFDSLSREEVEAMLDISFEETRVYWEIKGEGAADVILRELQLYPYRFWQSWVRRYLILKP
jgi:predicted transposase YdaD